VEALLIACTDLSPLITENTFSFVIVDTAASLSSATIKNYRRLSGKTTGDAHNTV